MRRTATWRYSLDSVQSEMGIWSRHVLTLYLRVTQCGVVDAFEAAIDVITRVMPEELPERDS